MLGVAEATTHYPGNLSLPIPRATLGDMPWSVTRMPRRCGAASSTSTRTLTCTPSISACLRHAPR